MAWVVVTALATTSAANADGPTGIEIGLRSGYTLPLGSVTGQAGDELGHATPGLVPIWVDLAYRVNPHIAVGAYFQYAVGHSNSTPDCQLGGACPSNDTMIGAQVHYHLWPDRSVDPWAGVGAGYETFYYLSEGGGTHEYRFYGFDLLNLHAGVDFKPMRDLGVGPFVTFNMGMFSSCSSMENFGGCPMPFGSAALHEWLTLGVRVVYDIRMPWSR